MVSYLLVNHDVTGFMVAYWLVHDVIGLLPAYWFVNLKHRVLSSSVGLLVASPLFLLLCCGSLITNTCFGRLLLPSAATLC